MTTNQKEQKFTFRPSWRGSINRMRKTADRLAAYDAITALGCGESVKVSELPEIVQVLLNEVCYSLDFDAKTNGRHLIDARTRAAGRPRYEVSEANEVTEGSEATEGNEVNEANEDSATASPSEEEEEAKKRLFIEKGKNPLRKQVREFYDYWNMAIERDGAKLKKVQAERIGSGRFECMAKRIQEFGLAKCMHAIDNATQSEFLNKEADATFNFDWFISYKNFTKVLEGNFQKCFRKKPLKAADDMPTKEDIENDKGLIEYE